MNHYIFHAKSNNHHFPAFMDMIQRYMKAGLLHAQRSCTCCCGPMRLAFLPWPIRPNHFNLGEFQSLANQEATVPYSRYHDDLYWVCHSCWNYIHYTTSTLVESYPLQRFDHALRLFLQCPSISQKTLTQVVDPTQMKKVQGIGVQIAKVQHIVRRALGHFYAKRVKPFLLLPGPIEIDETKVGREDIKVRGLFIKCPRFRWLFGLYCRSTKLFCFYHVLNRTAALLHPKIKANCPPGSIVISDEHSSYINIFDSRSKLAEYGYFHFWTNHSAKEYVHPKLSFLHSLNMERTWKFLKYSNPSMKQQRSYIGIEYVADFFSAYCMIKPEKLYDFTLSQINRYYFDKLALYQEVSDYQSELYYPRIQNIEHDTKKLSQQRMEFNKLDWHKLHISLRYNVDMHDLATQPPITDRHFLNFCERAESLTLSKPSTFYLPQSFSLSDPTSPAQQSERDISSMTTTEDRAYVRQVRRQACLERILVDPYEEEEEVRVYWHEGKVDSYKEYFKGHRQNGYSGNIGVKRVRSND